MSGPCDDELYKEPFVNSTYSACDFINDHPEDCNGESIINYRFLHFCVWNQSLWVAIPLGVIFLPFFFYVLGSTAEQYLTPALAKISQALKMSESLAGVTFLAFGNGAADVISSICASGLGEDGIYLASSGLVGSCVTNNLFLAPLVVLLSRKQVVMPSLTYSRDVVFLLLTITVLIVYFFYGHIHWYHALLFPIIYVLYVSVCFFQERLNLRAQQDREKAKTQLFEEDLAHSQTTAEATGEEIVRREARDTFVRYALNMSFLLENRAKEAEQAAAEGRQKAKQDRVITVSEVMMVSLRNRFWRKALDTAVKIAQAPEEEEEGKKGIIGKIFHYAIGLPFTILRNISIPPSNPDNWSRVRASIFLPFSFALICLFFEVRATNVAEAVIIPCILLLCIIAGVVIYFSTHANRPPSWLLLLAFISFFMSIIWLWGLANLLVDLLEIIGIVANLPLEFLGLTFLGFGNAMPDISTGIALARMGLSEMALTGCVAEPVFSMLVGLGSSMLRSALSTTKGYVRFSVAAHKQAILPLVGICLCLAMISSFFIFNCTRNFRMNKLASFVQLGVYAFFFGIIITLTILFPENSGHDQ